MKYKDRIKCECCKHDITMPHAVIEWGYDRIGSMHVCCHKCAFGNNPSNIISDMILDQPLYDADTVYDRLMVESSEITVKNMNKRVFGLEI